MKVAVSVLVALMVGYILGGWSPKSEVARLDQEVQSLTAKLAKSGPRKSSLGGIGRMLNVPASETGNAFDDIPDPTLDPEPEEAPAEPAAAPPAENRPGREPPRDFQADIERAVELWRVRSDLARGALLNQVNANEDDTVRFDVVMEAMNLRLETSIQKWADVLASDALPPQEAGIRMMNEITEALAITYDELDRNLAQDWKSATRETFELTDFIDPSVALPLANVQDKLDFQ